MSCVWFYLQITVEVGIGGDRRGARLIWEVRRLQWTRTRRMRGSSGGSGGCASAVAEPARSTGSISLN